MMQIQDTIRYVFEDYFNSIKGQPGGLATLDETGRLHRPMAPDMDDVYPALVVKRSFNSSTTWDLSDIILEEGVYQLTINTFDTTANTGDVWLLPNGASYSKAFDHSNLYWTASNSLSASFKRSNNQNAFYIGTTDCVHGLILISTYNKNKRLIAFSAANQDQSMNIIASWNSATTPWSTLGIITFAAATSGTVALRRLM